MCALFTQRVGELAAQALVFPGQYPVAVESGLQAGEGGCAGSALPGGDAPVRRGASGVPETLDLLSDVGLAVEPGPGDTGRGRDRPECDCSALPVEFPQCPDGLGAGQ